MHFPHLLCKTESRYSFILYLFFRNITNIQRLLRILCKASNTSQLHIHEVVNKKNKVVLRISLKGYDFWENNIITFSCNNCYNKKQTLDLKYTRVSVIAILFFITSEMYNSIAATRGDVLISCYT